MIPRASIALFFALSLLRWTASAQSLPGLTITGNTFTYNAPDGQVTGVLRVPAGTGPFPAVLISHGKGGSAGVFSQQHAATLVSWGFVCIGPNYTHAGSAVNTPDNEGYCPENCRRARRCLDILASMPSVDLTRVAAFGHSMGAFMTAGLLGEIPTQFRAACITAGGSSRTTNSGFASPSTLEVAGIRAPVLMFHGTADTIVVPAQSANLQTILNANGVPNKRLLYQGINHDIVQSNVKGADIHAIMRAWFTQHGLLAFPGNTAPTLTAPASTMVAASVPSVPVPVTLSDGEASPASLTVSAFTTDDARLSNAGLVFVGTGAQRNLPITANAGQTGLVEVALVVSDGQLSAVSFLSVSIQDPLADTDADGLPLWWELANGSSPTAATGEDGAMGNRDGDALPSLLEFYFVQDPAADSSGGAPVAFLSSDTPPFLHFQFLRRTDAPWLTSKVEVTSQFGVWQTGAGVVEPVRAELLGDGITERVTVRILPAVTSATPARFVRLRVQRGP